MLGFGLTLLGGCVATNTARQPSELYFPGHSVRPTNSMYLYQYALLSASDENMSAGAHQGYYLAEKITKSGGRASTFNWGIRSMGPDTFVRQNALLFCLGARLGATVGAHATHVQASLKKNEPFPTTDDRNVLYQSSDGLYSDIFELAIGDAQMNVTDSFSGIRRRTIKNFGNLATAEDLPVQYSVFAAQDPAICAFDFVVSSYRNAGLGLNLLTIPLRTLPESHANNLSSVFEYQTKTLIEL